MAHPSDPSAAAQVFVSAYHAAASAASERQRLAQSAQQQAMQHQIEQARIAQSARESEAKLAVETEYRKQQSELQQQQLAQKEKQAAMTAQVAYQKYQEAQREKEVSRQFQYEQQKRSLDASAERQRIGIESRQQPDYPPEEVQLGDQRVVWKRGSKEFQQIHPKGQMTEDQRDRAIGRREKSLETLRANNPNLDMETPDKGWSARSVAQWKAGREQMQRLEKEIESLDSGGNQTEGGPSSAGAKVAGKYTADGKFIPAQTATATSAAPKAANQGFSIDEQGTMQGVSAPDEARSFSPEITGTAAVAPAASQTAKPRISLSDAVTAAGEKALPAVQSVARSVTGSDPVKGLGNAFEAILSLGDLATNDSKYLQKKFKEFRSELEDYGLVKPEDTTTEGETAGALQDATPPQGAQSETEDDER